MKLKTFFETIAVGFIGFFIIVMAFQALTLIIFEYRFNIVCTQVTKVETRDGSISITDQRPVYICNK